MIDRNEGKHARIYIRKKEIGKEIEKNTARKEKKKHSIISSLWNARVPRKNIYLVGK